MITCWVQPPSVKKALEEKQQAEKAAAEQGKKKGKKGKHVAAGKEETNIAAGEEEEKEEKTRRGRNGKPKVKVRVVNADGDTVRTFSQEVDTGMVRIYWDLSRDGVRFPSRRQPRQDSDPPRGYHVLPGNYKLYLSLGNDTDSTEVAVFDDPRMGFRLEKMKAQIAAYDELAKIVTAATDGFDRLQDARKNIKVVKEALAFVPDSLKEEVNKLGKSLQDSIAKLERRYMMPEGLKGIQRDPNTINATLWQARNYINASDGAPNQSARIMMQQARKQVADVLKDINAFMAGPFDEYRQKVEALQASLFKDYQPVELQE